LSTGFVNPFCVCVRRDISSPNKGKFYDDDVVKNVFLIKFSSHGTVRSCGLGCGNKIVLAGGKKRRRTMGIV